MSHYKSRNNRFHYFPGSVKTSLMSGSSFNVTWHLAYPHRVSTHTGDHDLIIKYIWNLRRNVWWAKTSYWLCNPEEFRMAILLITIANCSCSLEPQCAFIVYHRRRSIFCVRDSEQIVYIKIRVDCYAIRS